MATAQDSLNETLDTSQRTPPLPAGGGDPLDMVIEADTGGAASESSRQPITESTIDRKSVV